MSWKIFLKMFVVSAILLLSIVFIFNYIIDPMGIFNHKYSPNYFLKIDERTQKSGYLTLNTNKFNNLLIGSSEFSYIHTDKNTFNYSLSGIEINEFEPYIKFFKKYNNLNTLYLGLEFEGSDIHKTTKHPYELLSKFDNKMFFIKYLLSSDTLKYSLLTIKQNLFPNESIYDREYNKYAFLPSFISKEGEIKRNKRGLEKTYLNFKYNPKYKNHLKKIKYNNKDIRIIVFTPIWYKEYLNIVLKTKKKEYKMWLFDIVDVFGEINQCNIYNPLSQDYSNFINFSHLNEKASSIFIQKMLAQDKSYCILLNKKNIYDYLRGI